MVQFFLQNKSHKRYKLDNALRNTAILTITLS